MVFYKQIMVVSQYIGNVILENVTNDDLECIHESLQGMAQAGQIDKEFIEEIHGG